MSKELEALNYVWYHYYTEELDQDEVDEIEKNLNVVQDGLKRLESIDNANPSEALECLEDIYRNAVFISDYDVFGKQHPTNISPETNKSISVQCDTIKQALLKAQIEHKALEIIKEKNVDVHWIKIINELEAYNEDKNSWEKELTEEEFNLLKEVLE